MPKGAGEPGKDTVVCILSTKWFLVAAAAALV